MKLLLLLLLVHQSFCALIEGLIEFPVDAAHLDVIKTHIELIEVHNDVNRVPLKQKTRVNQTGGFEFWYIPNGEYLLSVSSLSYNFEPFKTKIVVDEVVKAYIVQPNKPFDKPAAEIPHPIKVAPNPITPRREYLKKRSKGILDSGPLATIVNNPWYLGMAIFTLALIAVPMVLEKFDPETARLVQEQRLKNKAKSAKVALEGIEESKKDEKDEKNHKEDKKDKKDQEDKEKKEKKEDKEEEKEIEKEIEKESKKESKKVKNRKKK